MRHRGSTAALVLALVLFVPACGGGGVSGEIDRPATRALNEQIDLIEFAASAHRYDAARQGLVRLRNTATRFADRGSIDWLRLTAILDAADDLDRALADAG